MITIKKKHNIQLNDRFIKQYSSVVRYAYKRVINDNITKQSDLESYIKSNMKNIDLLDASWIKAAVKKATELSRDKKIYFGGKSNFFKRKYLKINELDKSIPLDIRGSSNDKGNRKAKLNLINNEIIFKPSKSEHYNIPLNLSKNEYKLLYQLENQCFKGENYFNIKMDKNYIYISFDESRLKVEESISKIKDRILGIDLNPNWIAFSIKDYKSNNLIHKEIIGLKELNKQSSNKKKHELYEIVKYIVNKTIHYQVDKVVIERLSIYSKNNHKGKNYNRMINNDWNRNDFVNNLSKWLNINDIKLIQINPAYSSFMGQIDHPEEYDSVAASLEIGYRGYLLSNGNKNYITDRVLNINDLLSTRWKKMIADQIFNTYIELYEFFKKKKFLSSYRFLFQCNGFSLRMNSIKSNVLIYLI